MTLRLSVCGVPVVQSLQIFFDDGVLPAADLVRYVDVDWGAREMITLARRIASPSTVRRLGGLGER